MASLPAWRTAAAQTLGQGLPGGGAERRSFRTSSLSVSTRDVGTFLHPLPATGDACLFYQWQAVTLTTVSPYQQPTSCPWAGSGSGRPVNPHALSRPVPRARPVRPQVSLCWECGGRGPSLPPPPLPFCEGSLQRCPLGRRPCRPLLRQGQQCWGGRGRSAPMAKTPGRPSSCLSIAVLGSSSHSGHQEPSVSGDLRPRERGWLG